MNEITVTSLHLGKEIAATSSAATAKALVESAYTIAMHRPRNLDNVRQEILRSCKRPRFADCAIYMKPVGNKRIEGPSIRFAETAIQAMHNIKTMSYIVFEDDQSRTFHVEVLDLEANISYGAEFGVKPTDLVSFLGHPLEQMTPATVTQLRGIYTAIKDGEASWKDFAGSKPAPERATIDLDKIAPGKVENHTPVTAPIAPKENNVLAAQIKERDEKLAAYEEQQAAAAAAKPKRGRPKKAVEGGAVITQKETPASGTNAGESPVNSAPQPQFDPGADESEAQEPLKDPRLETVAKALEGTAKLWTLPMEELKKSMLGRLRDVWAVLTEEERSATLISSQLETPDQYASATPLMLKNTLLNIRQMLEE